MQVLVLVLLHKLHWVHPCSNARAAHLVVEEDADYCSHHAQHVGERDGVAKHQQRDADDHDPFGGVGHGVAQRADQVQHAERDDVLGEVAEAADEQQDEGARPLAEIQLFGGNRRLP